MKTKLLRSDQIYEAISLLKTGEIVALPTETVYGLAADAKNENAIKKIFAAKNRPTNHPLIVHIDEVDKIKQWADYIPSYVEKLAKHFWPGPLTILLRKKVNVSEFITGNSRKIAIRIPNNHLILEIIKEVGGALVAPSANTYKKLSPTRAEHVMQDLSGKISAVLDGGYCSIGVESTILDLTSKIPTILRPGSIVKDVIENALQMNVLEAQNHAEQVPGNVLEHYQPNIPCFLVSLSEIKDYIANSENLNIAVMHYSPFNEDKVKFYKMPSDRLDFTRNMYDTLHKIDKMSFDKILIELPPENWIDVNDRLYKAQYKKDRLLR